MQQALCRPQGTQLCQLRTQSRQPLRTRTVAFAEGRESKPIREFREDTGEVSVPGGDKQQQQNGAIYADQVAMVSLLRRVRSVLGARRAHRLLLSWPHSVCVVHGSASCFNPPACPQSDLLQAKKKDNMSREMKQRLRQEYYGLGGAENTVSKHMHSC